MSRAAAVGPVQPGDALPGAARRTQSARVALLVATQVLGGVGAAGGIAVGGLLAQRVSGSTALAGTAQTMSVLGAAVLALPLAALAARRGRAPALALGYAVGAAGAALCLLSALLVSYPVLLLGAGLFGGGTASGLQARYAATDLAEPSRRGRSLSLVVWAATIGAVTGPNLIGPGDRLGSRLGTAPLSGAFLISTAAFVAACLLVLLLPAGRRPPAALSTTTSGTTTSGATTSGATTSGATTSGATTSGAQPGTGGRANAPRRSGSAGLMPVGRRLPGPAVLALVTLAGAHAAMVGVMVMTSVHLHDAGATLSVVGLVISAHVLGMYGLSPLMGVLVDRRGHPPVIAVGLTLIVVGCLLVGASAAGSPAPVAAGLTLLGLGWSACTVAGSTLLSASVPAQVRTRMQGYGDLTMGLAGACAGLLAGPLAAGAGFPALTVGGALCTVPAGALLVRHSVPGRGRPGSPVDGSSEGSLEVSLGPEPQG